MTRVSQASSWGSAQFSGGKKEACGHRNSSTAHGLAGEAPGLCGEVAPDGWEGFIEEVVFALTDKTLAGRKARTQSHPPDTETWQSNQEPFLDVLQLQTQYFDHFCLR